MRNIQHTIENQDIKSLHAYTQRKMLLGTIRVHLHKVDEHCAPSVQVLFFDSHI